MHSSSVLHSAWGQFLNHGVNHAREVVLVSPPPVLSRITVVQRLGPCVRWEGVGTSGYSHLIDKRLGLYGTITVSGLRWGGGEILDRQTDQ